MQDLSTSSDEMIDFSPTIAIVAGEISGDELGGPLASELKQLYPNAKLVGVVGDKMLAAGVEQLHNIDQLSVMGLFEILRHLPRILKLRKSLVSQLEALNIDMYIGIDAPEFNLGIEEKLKKQGIKTVHYASPSVWAWRQNRVFKIKRAVDLMLAFLPFEKQFYDKFNVPCRLIGHNLADQIEVDVDKKAYKVKLALNKTTLAILPGSRMSEVTRLAPVFLETANNLVKSYDLEVVVACANYGIYEYVSKLALKITPNLELKIILSNTRDILKAADVCLISSGTATLEAMLCKTPMVVGYKMSELTYKIAKKIVKTKFVSLPNLLAGQELVPELLQQDCNPHKLSAAIFNILDKNKIEQQQCRLAKFIEIHKQIKQDADKQAARAVADLLQLNQGKL